MIKKAKFGAVKAAIGCGALLIFFTGIFGIFVSFFANDPVLAVTIRRRCLLGIAIGILMIIAWKIFKNISSEVD